MRTSTSTLKAITSLSWLGDGMPKPSRIRNGASDSSRPSVSPPSMAPTMLPMPPSTAAVKALMPGRKPMVWLTWLKISVYRMPAAPASTPPMAKVMTMTRSTLMPIMAATSLFSLTARMARPVRVRSTKRNSATMRATAATVTTALPTGTLTPKMLYEPWKTEKVGYACTPAPYRPRKVYCRKRDAPMAVMSGTSRGALRSGR